MFVFTYMYVHLKIILIHLFAQLFAVSNDMKMAFEKQKFCYEMLRNILNITKCVVRVWRYILYFLLHIYNLYLQFMVF